MRGQKEDLNVRGAFLHMAADAGDLRRRRRERSRDPVYRLDVDRSADEPLVVAVIVYGTWGLVARRDAPRASAAVPSGVDLQRIREYLADIPGVDDVHDLHVWALSTTGNAITAHLVMPAGHPGDAFGSTASCIRLRERLFDASRDAASRTRHDQSSMRVDHPAEQH